MTRELAETTVIGRDKIGLITSVTTLLFEHGINVESLDQAVCKGIFQIAFHADTTEMTCSRDELRAALSNLGDNLGIDVQIRFPSDRETREIAVLVTKESHCLEALFETWANDDLGAKISIIIGSHDTLKPLTNYYDVSFHDIDDERGTASEERLPDLLKRYDVGLVVFAYCIHIPDPNVVLRYKGRIINIHLLLPPTFPGATAYRQAKEEGVHITDVAAHYVATDLDQGPIIAQCALDAPDNVSINEIKERGRLLEAGAPLKTVRLHLSNGVPVRHGHTGLRESAGLECYQLGLTREAQVSNPDRPVNDTVDALGGREALAPEPSED